MTAIGFIGLGNMGSHMAANLVKAGHDVKGFDIVAENVARFVTAGGTAVETVAEAAKNVDAVITMLPAGRHVRAVYTGDDGILNAASPATLLIDSSTIDVESARDVAKTAEQAGMVMIEY